MISKHGEVLAKAITKAITKGWNRRGMDSYEIVPLDDFSVHGVRLFTGSELEINLSVFDLIFSHDFARALWGEKLLCAECGRPMSVEPMFCTNEKCIMHQDQESAVSKTAWVYHLQKMVIKEDPIAYLRK